MKLESLARVGELNKSRAYLLDLQAKSQDSPNATMGGFSLRPEIITALRPHFFVIIEAEINKVDAELAELGVSVE